MTSRATALRRPLHGLHFHCIDVFVGADLEGHRQTIGAIVPLLEFMYSNVLSAIDLLLDGSGD